MQKKEIIAKSDKGQNDNSDSSQAVNACKCRQAYSAEKGQSCRNRNTYRAFTKQGRILRACYGTEADGKAEKE